MHFLFILFYIDVVNRYKSTKFLEAGFVCLLPEVAKAHAFFTQVQVQTLVKEDVLIHRHFDIIQTLNLKVESVRFVRAVCKRNRKIVDR